MSNKLAPTSTQYYAALPPAADAAGRTSGYYSLKNANKAYAVVAIKQGNAATVELSFEQAKTVAGGSTKGFDAVKRIWASNDIAVTKDVAAVTAAAGYTTDAALKDKLVVVELDPADLDFANGFDCVAITTGASNAANITTATLVIETAYAQAAPPTATAD